MSAWLGFTSQGRAQPADRAGCAEDATRFLAIVVPDTNSTADVDWHDVVRHVQGELQARGVRACAGAPRRAPFGWLELEPTTPERVRIALRFADGAGAERSLELGAVPADARALSIAVAADELLASNWASVEKRVKIAPSAAPPEPTAAREAEPAPPFALGPSFVFEAFAGGQKWLGADARFGSRLAAPLGLTLRLGARQALPHTAPHGSVHASALGGGLGLRWELFEDDTTTFALLGRADAWRVAASAYAAPGAASHEARGLAVVLSVGPSLELRLSRLLRLRVEAAGGGAARPVYVTDSGERVTGASGWALSLAGGVDVAF